MSLKREMLVEAGITDKDVLDSIMQAYGAGIENAKTQIKSEMQAENDTLKEQLQAQTDKVAELVNENNQNADIKATLERLQTEYSNFKADSEAKITQINRNNAIALALKDVKAHDSDLLMKLIDVEKVTFDDNGKPNLTDTINSLKESKPFLFATEEQNSPQMFVGGNPNGNGNKEVDPFQAIIQNYK